MILLKKINIWTIYLFILSFVIIFSTFNLNGFLTGHLGWHGPHLFAASVNVEVTKFFFADGIYNDGSFHLYNHHPPLGFYLFYFVSIIGNNLSDKLQLAAQSIPGTWIQWPLISS